MYCFSKKNKKQCNIDINLLTIRNYISLRLSDHTAVIQEAREYIIKPPPNLTNFEGSMMVGKGCVFSYLGISPS